MVNFNIGEDENKVRGNWSGRLDFILSCLGFCVGLGNVWRFPYLAYSYGGALFLIPYAVSLLVMGIPMFLLDISLGQFTSSGPLTCWQMAPIFQGLGAAMLIVSGLTAIYYNMIIAWAIYYIFASVSNLPGVPWSSCSQVWATPFCGDYIWKSINSPMTCSKAQDYDSGGGSYIPFENGLCIGVISHEVDTNWFENSTESEENSFYYDNSYKTWANTEFSEKAFDPIFIRYHSHPIANSNFTRGLVGFWDDKIAAQHNYKRQSSSSEYFSRRVLKRHKSEGLTNLDQIHWDLFLSLLAAWMIVFLCLMKGIKSSGKVVYVTVLFPYAVLFTLLIRGSLLDGAKEGILYYLRGYGTAPEDAPNSTSTFYMQKLANIEIWEKAAEQIFFSLSTCYGGLISLSSYNKFHNNVYRDTMIVAFGNCITSFFAGFVVFSFLGSLATKLNVKVSDVAQSGITLAFIVYPEAVTHIPPAPVWSVLFFVMLLTLGMDSEFALMETILTSLMDLYPSLRPHKMRCVAMLCAAFFVAGLTMCTSGGIYVLVFLDTFAGGWNVLLIAIFECIAVIWVYSLIPYLTGSSRSPSFLDDIKVMMGTDKFCWVLPWRYFRWFWLFMWAFVTPIVCSSLIIMWLVSFATNPTLQEGDYQYERGFIVLGWLITALVILVIIIGAILAIRDTDYSILEACKPSRYWGPALPQHRLICIHHPNIDADPWDNDLDDEIIVPVPPPPAGKKASRAASSTIQLPDVKIETTSNKMDTASQQAPDQTSEMSKSSHSSMTSSAKKNKKKSKKRRNSDSYPSETEREIRLRRLSAKRKSVE